MEKLKLDLEKLEVQTFDTTAESNLQGGTVFGFETVNLEDSCAVTYCPDCDVTATGCDVENTNNCESVNPLFCVSAYYSDCNCGGSYSTCGETSYDPWKWNCS